MRGRGANRLAPSTGILVAMGTGNGPGRHAFAAADVHYPSSGGARAAAVVAGDPAFAQVLSEHTAVTPKVQPYRPGEFYLRELPPLRAVLRGIPGLGLLVIDGYADLDPGGTPGLGAYAHEEFGIPVIGVAKSAFRTATHAIPVRRGTSARPLFVTAAGMSRTDAAELVRHMAGRFRIPDALRRADALARAERPAPGSVAGVEFTIRPMTAADAHAIAAWRYPGEYSFYDAVSDPDDLAELLDPAEWGQRYFAADDTARQALAGLLRVTLTGRVADIGLGLRPDLTGRGLGESFVRACLRFVTAALGAQSYTLAVAAFNRRAITVYERAGFRQVERFEHVTNGAPLPFVRMARSTIEGPGQAS